MLKSETVRALRDAGWHEGRNIAGRVEQWLHEIASKQAPDGSRFPEAPTAVFSFLCEFGGIYVDVEGSGRSMEKKPFLLDPREDLLSPLAYAQLSDAIGATAYPVGVLRGEDAAIAGDSEGRVLLIAAAGEMIVGENPIEALNNLVIGVRPEYL